MRRRPGAGRAVAFLAASLILLTAPAADAQGDGVRGASVRFVNALPATGAARLEVAGVAVGPARFGEATGEAKVPAGRRRLAVTHDARGGGAARTVEELEAGEDYTVVALLGANGEPAVRAYRGGDVAGGRARVRAINAAPELGAPAVRVGDRVLGERLPYGGATPYQTIAPGTYAVTALDPGDGTVVEERSAALTAGTASTAVLVGTRGEPLQVALVGGARAAPEAAPETGLGGLARGDAPRWLLALLAALGAGALGGFGFRLARRNPLGR